MRTRVLVTLALLALFLSVGTGFAAAPNDSGYGQQWGMKRIGVEPAWTAATGQGILISVVDSGIHLSHEDLAVPGKLVAGRDYIDEEPPQDEDGHGTHVAGIAAAATGNGKGVVGVAPQAQIMPVRVLNAFGVNVQIPDAERNDILASSADAVVYSVDRGAKVINLSLGSVAGGGPGSALANAINYAWSKGVICVVAAGNDDGQPSGYRNERALVVAATEPNDEIASYSNQIGEAVWGISAPGSSVYSTLYTYPVGGNNEYGRLSGTSMAAPHVSGAVALLRSMGFSPQQAVDRLLATALDLGSPGRDPTFGAGLLDIGKAAFLPSQSGSGGSGSRGSGSTNPGSRKQSGNSVGGGGAPATGQQQQQTQGQPAGAAPSPEAAKTKAAADEQKSNKTMINLIIGAALVGGGLGYYLWSTRQKKRAAS